MSSSSKEVFLSYSRQKELEPFVKKLKHDLEGQGMSVWLDIEDIPPGTDVSSMYTYTQFMHE